MNTATHYYFAGMGQPSAAQIGGAAASGASTAAVQIIQGNYIGGAGSALLTAAMIPGPQAPFLAIAGAAAELLGAIGIGRGCGQTCIVASQYANKAESLLQQNYNTYFALPTPRAQSAQQAALNVFDQVWQGLVQACSNPQLADAGKRCVTDRQAGACKWKDANGQCWNWFSGYRDPIANDPNVVADSPLSAVTNLFGSGSGGMGTGTILLIGAAVLGVVLLVGVT